MSTRSRAAGTTAAGLAGALALVALLLPRGSKAAAQDPFERDLLPLLARYCHKCHGPEKPKGKLDLTPFRSEKAVLAARKTWKKVWEKLHLREMPPEDKPQPAPAERDRMTAWIEQALMKLDAETPRDPGRVVLRRLSRVEYNNTVRDLVGVDFRPAEDFPSDDVGYGFDNIGDVLTLPPLLLEKYLAAAEKIMRVAIVPPVKPESVVRRLEGEKMDRTAGDLGPDRVFLPAGAEASAPVEFPFEGRYEFRIRARPEPAGSGAGRLVLRIDGADAATFDMPAERQPRPIELPLPLKAGKKKVAVSFRVDPPDPGRRFMLDWIDVAGPIDGKPPEPPESHRRIFVAQPGPEKTKRQAAAEIVSRFAARAFRRPVSTGEVDRFVGLYETAERQGEPFEAAMRLPLLAVLVSPHFLFRVERPAAGADPKEVSDFELATRLSYFLWSSMPDDTLLDRAAKGALRDPAALAAEARRMLADPKAKALAENFAVQWLQLRRLEAAAPDGKRFPGFDEALREAMLRETVLFFDAVVREDRGILELLDADFTFVNERLAGHYGIAGVSGPEMRRVKLGDPRRGGVLTMASVLTATSDPTRTSAVKRGKWVLETILGTPPPPALPGVSDLKDDPVETDGLSLRQRLERHRSDPNCASCHQRMDPIGFGFENYDAIGAWREKDGPLPIDSAATLPDGRSFKGPVELKKLFLSRREEFARCFTEKLMTYALGRGVEYYDAGAIKEVARALAEKRYRFSVLVEEIVRSYPFQYRRGKQLEGKDD